MLDMEGKVDDRCGPHFRMGRDTMAAFQRFLSGTMLFRMGRDTMAAFQRFLSGTVLEGELFSTDWGEKSTKPREFFTLAKLGSLARALAERKRRTRMLNEEEAIHCHGEDDIEDVALHVKQSEEDVPEDDNRGSNTSHEDAIFGTESSFKSSSGTGFGDVVVKAFDTNYLKEHKSAPDDKSKLVTFVVFELKGDDAIGKVSDGGAGGIFQAADCAVEEAFHNMALGRLRPIWLIVWLGHFWTYGCLVLERVVEISEEGQLLAEDNGLQECLASANAKLRAHMRDVRACYQAGPYLVGELFVSSEVLQAPTNEALIRPAWRFYESLLRLFLGDRVLSWNKDDVDALITEVEEMTSMQGQTTMDGITDERLEGWRSSKRLRSK